MDEKNVQSQSGQGKRVRVFGTGDDHIVTGSRWDECKRIHTWIADEVRREKPDLFVNGGDIFHKASTPEEREFAAEWVQSIADVCPFIMTRGNHDATLDTSILGRLSARHPIIAEQGAAVHIVAGVAVAAVAWPKRSNLAVNAPGASPEELDQLTRQAFQNVMRGLGQQLAEHDGPRLGLGHFMTDGAKTSTGQPLVGHSGSVGLDDLALLGAPLTLMSHIHLPQSFELNGQEFVYMGSPYRRDYGEDEVKSYTVAEYDGPRLVGWHRVETPCTAMLLREADWQTSPDGSAGFTTVWEPSLSAGAEVRLRFTCSASQRSGAVHAAEALKREWLDAGAVSVLLDPQTTTVSTAKAPQIAEADTTAEKLRMLWQHRNEDVPPWRAARLMDKLAEIESEAG